MPWIIWQIASGRVFFAGVVLLLAGVALRPLCRRRKVAVVSTLAAIIGAGFIGISATALSVAVYVSWSVAMLYWLLADERRMGRWSAAVPRSALIAITLLALGVEAARQLRPAVPGGAFPRLYVVGDSISAGISLGSIKTWPGIIRSDHHVEVDDLSRPGASASDACRRVGTVSLEAGIVLLEIGGNDLIGRGDATAFETALDQLCAALAGADRKLIMLELPLPPFANAFGRAQRRIADRYHITLIPRRYFVGILSAPGATSDGIHLTAAGQQEMAAMIWGFVGTSLKQQ
jgi:lysophospholipase L1-like esterase